MNKNACKLLYTMISLSMFVGLYSCIANYRITTQNLEAEEIDGSETVLVTNLHASDNTGEKQFKLKINTCTLVHFSACI